MKKNLIQIIISFVLFLIAILIPFENDFINKTLYIISYLIVGLEIVLKAIKNIFKGNVLDEHFLMAIATIGAFAIGEFPEAVAVMLFYQVGELFQDYAVDKSRKSIANLMDIRPDIAFVKRNGKIEKVSPEDVKIGENIVVKPGEKVPLDGTVVEGNSMLDTSALTGESLPKEVNVGDNILSGCINKNGLLTIKVEKKFGESTVSKILDLVENASSKKSKSENFITKFAKYYTPIVVIIAILLSIIPPFILNVGEFTEWLYRALTFLVVSCPCALVISIPLGFFGGIGGASKVGILVKGSNYLEALSNTEIVIFDKTGTLTEGVFEVQKVKPVGISKDELLRYATYAESNSNHPISVSLRKAYNRKVETNIISNVEELAGRGVRAKVEGKEVLIGNDKLMEERNIEYTPCNDVGTILYVAIDNKYVGYILIADKIKKDSARTIKELKHRALSISPELIVCDEPVSALDVSIQAQVINLFKKIQQERKLTYVFISHDLGIIKYISDRIIIMYLGRIMETYTAHGIYSNPLHPYTKALLSAIPPESPFEKKERMPLHGDIPSPIGDQVGCPLASRCPNCTERCKKEIPKLKDVGDHHMVACFLYE